MVTNDNVPLEWITDISRLDFDSLVQFFGAVGFGEASDYEIFRGIPDYVNKSMGMFSHSILAFEKGLLVGLAHVFSDECSCSWLAEICVHPRLQRRGVGRELMGRVNDRFGHTPLYLQSFPSQTGFFQKCGILPKPKLVACAGTSRSVPPETEPPQGIRIINGLPGIEWEQIGALYTAAGFEAETRTVGGCFGIGIIAAFALAEGRLVGLARAMTNFLEVAWLAEICVHPDWQRQGIGHALLSAIRRQVPKSAFYADAFASQTEFFSKCGVTPRPMLVSCSRGPIGPAGERHVAP
ncbi:MAG: GNAT family N-acetyltransferase [Magnetospirillum sp.]|nr:GNAT family N-acetyltransferase [Magnetospirillum sp.]